MMTNYVTRDVSEMKNMTTEELRNYLREIRIEHNELLKHMADKLGMRSAELSAIENGKKPLPEGFLRRIQNLYMIGE